MNVKLLDGATGTMYFQAGLPVGECPEKLNLTHAQQVTEVSRAYVQAGAQIVYANTFGANRYKVARAGQNVTELVQAGVRNAKMAVAGTQAKVALDIGPIGKLLEPYGDLPFADAVEAFAEMIVAGEQAGADLIVFETMADLYEVKAGLLAARLHSQLPVFVTMTFEGNGRTYTGTSVEAFTAFATAWGVDALGVNCSLGPVELYPIVQKMAQYTRLPLIVKANAGLPNADNTYNFSPTLFAQEMCKFQALGVAWMGGCCGTSPAHIAELRTQLEACEMPCGIDCSAPLPSIFGSASQVVIVDEIVPVGEQINPTNKPDLLEELLAGDMDLVQDFALEQQDNGAKMLDINVGGAGLDEAETMRAVVCAVQEVCNLPLILDSARATVLEAGLRVVNGKCIINSVKATAQSVDTIFPLAKKYGAGVIALTMDETGMPETAQQRVQIATRILEQAAAYGIPAQDIIIDCLVLGDAYFPDQRAQTLEAVRQIRAQFPQVHCTLGISNISHGMPDREVRNAEFLQQALEAGVDMPILNLSQTEVLDVIEQL